MFRDRSPRGVAANEAHGAFLAKMFGFALALSSMNATSALAASPPSWLGAVSAGGTGSYTAATGVQVAPDGSQYVTGQFSATASFSAATLTSSGGADAFLAKYSAGGQLLWIVKAGGTQDDISNGVALDKDGNVYIAGWYSSSSATFGSANGITKTVAGNPNTLSDFVAKYSASGVLQWVQTGVTTGGTNQFNSVTVNPVTGSVYLTGVGQYPNIVFSSADGTSHNVSGAFTWHMLLVKYDANGNFKWAQTNAANPNSIGVGVAADSADNAYVTGWFEDSATFSSANGNSITINGFSGPVQYYPDYPSDAFLVKYDSSGNVQWANHIGGYKGNGSSVAVSPCGKVTMTGAIGNIGYGSSAQAQTIVTSQAPGANVNLGGGVYTNPYNPDGVIATYDPAGVLLSALRLGGSEADAANGVAYDPQCALFVAGTSQAPNASPQLHIWKYATNGALSWEQVAANAGLSVSAAGYPAVALNGAGDVFVAGQRQGTAQFGTIQLPGLGSSDAYLAVLGSRSGGHGHGHHEDDHDK